MAVHSAATGCYTWCVFAMLRGIGAAGEPGQHHSTSIRRRAHLRIIRQGENHADAKTHRRVRAGGACRRRAGRGAGHPHRRKPAHERAQRRIRRAVLRRRRSRGRAHQCRQDAVEKTGAGRRGQPGDAAARCCRHEQAGKRREGALRAVGLHRRLQGHRAGWRQGPRRIGQRRRHRPRPGRAGRVFLERHSPGQPRGAGAGAVLQGARLEEGRAYLCRRSRGRSDQEGTRHPCAQERRQHGQCAAGAARLAAVFRRRRKSARSPARRGLHRLVRRAAGADRQAIARQRRQAAAGGLLGVFLADRDPVARGQGRPVPDPVGQLGGRSHQPAPGARLEGQDRQGC